ncbi:MAG TPA: alpha/beta hydrolase-fold protein [Blastocatellia bacterium]|nr:alpha/beta hydrolase-fold protein [Blastocatellia bacterium]
MNKSIFRFLLLAVATAAVFQPVATRYLFAQEPPAQPTAPAPDTGVQYASLQSPSLERELKYAVQLPPSYERDTKRRYPLLYFLHGMNGNEREFERRGVAGAVAKMRGEGKIGEFIIIAPAGENSFYLNAKNGVRYEDAIIKDLIPHVEKTYRVVASRDGRAIQGLSMGGYGALMLAFKHPEMFSSVTAHSSALFVELPNPTGTDRRAQFMSRLIGNMYGNPPDVEYFKANNPIDLAATNAAAIKKAGLKIYFDVGEQDRYGFQPSNKALDEQLTKAAIVHEYHVFPGGHGWEYMLSVADNSYTFLWKNFKGNEKAARASR